MHRAELRRLGLKWLVTLVVLALGNVLFLPVNVFRRVQVWDAGISLIDDTWTLNIPWRLSQGEIAGRDFVYTYGPLWQVLHATGLLLGNHDAASLYRYLFGVECLLVTLSVWGLLSFTGAPLRWKVLLFLGWMLFLCPVEHQYIGLRPHGALWLVAACGYFALRQKPWERRVAILLWTATVPVLLLYSFDSGVYGLTALLALGLCLRWAVAKTPVRGVRPSQLLAACGVGLFILWLSSLLLPGWRGYMANSWQVASGYAAVMALGANARSLAALFLAGLILLLAIVWCSRRTRTMIAAGEYEEASRSAAFLGIAWFGLFFVRGGVTRSDSAHVVLAFVPVLFLCCVMATGHAVGLRRRWAPAWVLVGAPFWVLMEQSSQLFSLFPMASAGYSVITKLPGIFQWETGPATIRISNQKLQNALLTIGQSGQIRELYCWPNFGILNVLLDEPSPDYTVQTYSAHTEALEERTIQNLEARRDIDVFFPGFDLGLNGVQSCTRNSIVFRYLLENYHVSSVGGEGSAMLAKRARGMSTKWSEEPLGVPASHLDPGSGKALTVRLPNDQPLGRYGEFFLLRLKCPSSPLLAVAKPGRISVGFRLKDGAGERSTFQRLALPPDGKEHLLLVSARTVQDPAFLHCFALKPVTEEGPEISAIGLIWEPLDMLSVRPARIDVLSISKLKPPPAR